MSQDNIISMRNNDAPLHEMSLNAYPNSSPLATMKRTFSDIHDGDISATIDTKDIVTPPNSTIRGNGKNSKAKLHRQPLSPELSSPITHSKAKKQKSETSGSSRSNGNLTLDELVQSFASRRSQCELSKKPPYSYATLISLAILQSDEGKLTLSQIYNWISVHFPYYKQKDAGWQNSIRHNLSLNEAFVKTQKSGDGKGHFWEVKTGYESKFFKNETGTINEIREKLKVIDQYFQSTVEILSTYESKLVTDAGSNRTPNNVNYNDIGSNYNSMNSTFEIDNEQSGQPQRNSIEASPDFPMNLSPSIAVHSNSAFQLGSKFSPMNGLDQPDDVHLIQPFQEKRFHSTLGFHRNSDKSNIFYENSGNSLNHLPMGSSHLLKSPKDFKKYTSSFNSSFEETSPLPSRSRSRSILGVASDDVTGTNSISTSTVQYQASSTLFVPTQPLTTDLLRTPKVRISDNLEKTPVRFITTPRDEDSVLKKWQTPSNLLDDFYCSPLFKGMGTPVKLATTPGGYMGKTFSPDNKLALPHMIRDSTSSKISSSGLFGVDVYSLWKRATGTSHTKEEGINNTREDGK